MGDRTLNFGGRATLDGVRSRSECTERAKKSQRSGIHSAQKITVSSDCDVPVCEKGTEKECGALFFLSVVEARSARVRSGKGR